MAKLPVIHATDEEGPNYTSRPTCTNTLYDLSRYFKISQNEFMEFWKDLSWVEKAEFLWADLGV